MNEQCEKCLGQGLVGSGDKPHMLEGRRVTCSDCHGTGLKPGASAEPEQAPVDNQPGEEQPGGILRRIFG